MESKNIPLFVPKFRIDEINDQINQCLVRGWTGMGYKTLEFEQAWKQYANIQNAHFLNSATAGLYMAVAQMKQHYGWRDNDEIITTPLTFVSTNHAILHAGLLPVFADVDQYMCLDPQSVEDRITSKTRAVMFVGLGGNSGQYLEIVKLCRDKHLKLIFDASHCAGTKIVGLRNGGMEQIGNEAWVSIFSFQAVKNLPTADSGMICWQDPEMDILSRKLSWLGIDKDTFSRSTQSGYQWNYDVQEVGWKYHGNSVMAAMGLVGLKYLDGDNDFRRELAKEYDHLLYDLIDSVPMERFCSPSRHLYQILVNDREKIIDALRESGIGTGVHYISNTQYKMYRGFVPKAEKASKRLLSLPLHLHMTLDDDVYYVVERLGKAIAKAAEKKARTI